ncbi:CC/Se motif family (seleno)protein [Sporosalibacterium faouarense]|uniref:CC/Se motif family (seleno)protein n=1 Tax=Sporosalibacterium faouarense TaxID=516123 RepID=UPI00192C96A9
MKFQIEPEAKAYIVEKNQAIMIMLSSMSGCCGGAASMPKIELGAPRDVSKFEKMEVEEITIYCDKEIETVQKIKIGLSRLFYFKKLTIELAE